MNNARTPMMSALAFAAVGLLVSFAGAQEKDKKDEKKKEPPQIIMANPLAVSPGQKVTVTLRGLKLDNVTAITLGEGGKAIKAEVKSKGAAKPPDRYEAAKVGDTQAQIEFTLPADFAAGSVKIIAANMDGESKTHELQVIAGDKLVQEKEPNDSFKGAQPIAAGQTLAGVVAGNNQVDVFAFTGKAGEKVTIEVLAARLGSALDASITLFDPSRNIVATVDDVNGSRDPVLALTLPSDGTYLIVLQDAMDRGEQTHPYLLRVR